MVSVTWILFVTLVCASAIVDVVSYRIPNKFVLALVLIFCVVAALHMSEVFWVGHLGAFTMMLGAGIVFYAFGQMGAGDVKLLGVIALWSGLDSLVPLLLSVSVCAFAGMIVILILRFALRTPQSANSAPHSRTLPEVLQRGRGIPYGIGIGPGAVIASFGFPTWLWH